MSVEENTTRAKRNIYICKSANLEGITVTYPKTDSVTISRKLKIDDTVTINNLKYAWEICFGILCKINQYAGGNNLIFGSGSLR